ncbi:hypothetical protein JOM56_006118 [Amanita muscaria]
MYDLGANSGENVHHLVETGQGNSWPMLRACADALPISRDTSQFDTEARIAVVDEQLLHAPVPLSGQQPLFFSGTPNYAGYLELQQLQTQVVHETGVSSFQGYYAPQEPLTDVSALGDLQYPQEATQSRPNDIAPYQDEAPTRTFPTPSELLVELASTNQNAHCNSSRNSSDLSRRPRRRPVSRGLGVIPGDPPARESISSHEKKRQYLECLEYYVMFLQQQLSLVGADPVLLERVPQYRGLNNRSIRTLLVHMQSTTERLNMRTLREEQRFLELRDSIYSQDAAGATVQTFQDQTIDNEESLNRSFFR